MMKLPFMSAIIALGTLLTQLPAAAQESIRVLKAARMLDVETGKLISPATIVVSDGKILAVNPKTLPDAATVITKDLGDVTLMPGLIDVHTHLTLDYQEGNDLLHHNAAFTAAEDALRGARNARTTLLAGFTTVRDLGAFGFADIALMKAIDIGHVEGPEIIPSAHALSITGGHCDLTGYVPGVLETGPEQGISDGRAEVMKAVRYQIKHGAKVIKICATAGVLSLGGQIGNQQFNIDELKAAVEETHRHGLKIAAHAHGTAGINAALEAGVDSIEHGTILDDAAIAGLKKSKTYLVPTVYLIESFDTSKLPPALLEKAVVVGENAFIGLKRAIEEKVVIAYGTDAGVYPHGLNARQLSTFVKSGMTPIDAIKTTTVNAAKLFGTEDRGRLAVGLRADVIAVEGNPLQSIQATEKVSFVMKGGKIYRDGNINFLPGK